MSLLTDDAIEEMANMALFQSEQDLKENTRIPALTARQKEIEQGISNITKAIEKGVASDTLLDRLTELEKEKKGILKQIAEENKLFYKIDRKQITGWLYQFKNGDISDDDFKRQLIDMLVNSVTVWDEPDGYKITTAYNLTSCKTKTFRVDNNQEFGLESLSSTRKSCEIFDFTAFLQLFEGDYMDANHSFLLNFGIFWEIRPRMVRIKSEYGESTLQRALVCWPIAHR